MSPLEKAAESAQPTPLPRALWIGLGVIVLAIAGYLVYQKYFSRTEPTPTATPGIIAATPDEYRDFVGQLSAVNGSELIVNQTITRKDGSVIRRQLTVTIGDETELQTITIVNGQASAASLEPTDLKANDVLQVFSNENVADLDSFTAARIIKLTQTN